jgi:hypothetical protein
MNLLLAGDEEDFEELDDIETEDDLDEDEEESLETETCPICGCEIDTLGCCECDDEYED